MDDIDAITQRVLAELSALDSDHAMVGYLAAKLRGAVAAPTDDYAVISATIAFCSVSNAFAGDAPDGPVEEVLAGAYGQTHFFLHALASAGHPDGTPPVLRSRAVAWLQQADRVAAAAPPEPAAEPDLGLDATSPVDVASAADIEAEPVVFSRPVAPPLTPAYDEQFTLPRPASPPLTPVYDEPSVVSPRPPAADELTITRPADPAVRPAAPGRPPAPSHPSPAPGDRRDPRTGDRTR